MEKDCHCLRHNKNSTDSLSRYNTKIIGNTYSDIFIAVLFLESACQKSVLVCDVMNERRRGFAYNYYEIFTVRYVCDADCYNLVSIKLDLDSKSK